MTFLLIIELKLRKAGVNDSQGSHAAHGQFTLLPSLVTGKKKTICMLEDTTRTKLKMSELLAE